MCIRIIGLALVLWLGCAVTTVQAWVSTPHKIIAEIAYSQLHDCARQKVHTLISTLKETYPGANTIARASVLPDVLRFRGVKDYDRWHYIDIPYAKGATPTLPSKGENIVWALQFVMNKLKDPKTPIQEQAFYFSFLLHLVGDAHQPMHNITRYTINELDGDKGGNAYPIRTRRAKNLHEFWEQGMNFFHARGPRASLRPKAVRAFARWLKVKYPAREWHEKVIDTNPEHWVENGYNIAKTYAYRTPKWQRPHPAYVKIGRQILEQRVALAGYRLAYILNQLYACPVKEDVVPEKKIFFHKTR